MRSGPLAVLHELSHPDRLCGDQGVDAGNYADQNNGYDQAIFNAHEGIHLSLPRVRIFGDGHKDITNLI
jgi:hypothetical protein